MKDTCYAIIAIASDDDTIKDVLDTTYNYYEAYQIAEEHRNNDMDDLWSYIVVENWGPDNKEWEDVYWTYSELECDDYDDYEDEDEPDSLTKFGMSERDFL